LSSVKEGLRIGSLHSQSLCYGVEVATFGPEGEIIQALGIGGELGRQNVLVLLS